MKFSIEIKKGNLQAVQLIDYRGGSSYSFGLQICGLKAAELLLKLTSKLKSRLLYCLWCHLEQFNKDG